MCSFECYVLAINSVKENLPKNDDLSLCSLGEDFLKGFLKLSCSFDSKN